MNTAVLPSCISNSKQVGARKYIRATEVENLSREVQGLVNAARSLVSAKMQNPYHVIRIDETRQEVAFLQYPGLGEEPFPRLYSSWRVHVPANLVTYRTYAQSLNPPILHRTELFLPDHHPNKSACLALTRSCEALGLFDNTTIIGFDRQWQDLIHSKGYELNGFELIPIGNAEDVTLTDAERSALVEIPLSIERHKTALSRTTLSAPVQALIRDGLLHSGNTLFDYGCGRGDDIAALLATGIEAAGWDPHFRPDAARRRAAAINLGFVINVIEDRAERIEALETAFELADEVLAVATMLASNAQAQYARAFKDGVVTSRNTFQKYYTQGELQQFLEAVLEHDAYPAAPGVFYVFKDRTVEQSYLLRKNSDRFRAVRIRIRSVIPARVEKLSPRTLQKEKYSEQANGYLERIWARCLELGRPPALHEMPDSSHAIASFGSARRVLKACLSRHDDALLNKAREGRQNDILVMMALQYFGRRRRFTQFDSCFQRDIKAFFGSYQVAESHAQALLFSVQDPKAIRGACQDAAAHGLGWLAGDHSLQLHTSLIARLLPPLRVYIGCATALAGDLTSFDLVKAHIDSGKVTLMRFDDFAGKPLPALQLRIKVRLRDQDLDIFEYQGQYPATVLYHKSRYINEEFPHYAEQVAFEEALDRSGCVDLNGYGLEEAEFHRRLSAMRREVAGFELARSRSLPHLDEKCGRTFTYRQLIECGETWSRTRTNNIPARAETYNALYDLATGILDPVVEFFGIIKLTYGFASTALCKQIRKNIAPKLDQHASCETNRQGSLISPRLGAAVDFLVEFEDMLEVAKWIASNCEYDRLYYYGPDRPLHVSIGPENKKEAFEMRDIGGRRVPRPLSLVM